MRDNPSREGIEADKERTFIQDCLGAYLFHDPALITSSDDLEWNIFYQLLLQNKLVGLFSIVGRS
jgi:hypothetical protein